MQLELQGLPNEKQELFFKSTARHVAYGGARGGGKSWAMRRKFILLALNYSILKLLLLRRTLPELRENHLIHMLSELHGIATYKETEKSFLFPNGSRIRLGYCDNEKDVYQYQGAEFDVIGFEEATHFTESQRDFLLTCNRNTRADFTPRAYYTSNPGGVGHEWFKRLFIDREYIRNEKEEDYVFIPARVYDNKILIENNREYVEALENLPSDMRKAHLDGDWDVFAGKYFREFNRDIHVVEPFDIPKHWERYVSIDYGLDMFAVLWYAIDTQNNVYAYKELHESDLVISEAANRFLQKNNRDKIEIIYAPPDLWNRRQDSGKSAEEIFRENGVILIKSKNERVNGWYSVKECLKTYDTRDEFTGEVKRSSKLKIFDNCKNLIKNLQHAQYDDKNVNDVSNTPHELTHILDSLRYFLCMRTFASKEPRIRNMSDTFYGKKEKESELIVDESFLKMGVDF